MGNSESSDEEGPDENVITEKDSVTTTERVHVTGRKPTTATECPKFNVSYDCPTYTLKLEMLMVIDSNNITYRNDLLCFSRNIIRRLNGTDINPVVIVENRSVPTSKRYIESVDDYVLSFQHYASANSLSIEDIQSQISTFENYTSETNKTGIVLLLINDVTSEDSVNLTTPYSEQQSHLYGISYRSNIAGDKKLDIITSMSSCTYKRFVNTTSGLETVGDELDEIACNATGYLEANCPATSIDLPSPTPFTYSKSTSSNSTDISAMSSTHVALLAGGLMMCVVLILIVALIFVYRKKMEPEADQKGMQTFSSDQVYNNEMMAHYQPGTENVDIYKELQHRKSSALPSDVYSHSHKRYTEVDSEMYDHTNVQNLHPLYNESDVYDHAQSSLYGRSSRTEVDPDIYDHSDGKNNHGADMYDSTYVNRNNFDDLNMYMYASTQTQESM